MPTSLVTLPPAPSALPLPPPPASLHPPCHLQPRIYCYCCCCRSSEDILKAAHRLLKCHRGEESDKKANNKKEASTELFVVVVVANVDRVRGSIGIRFRLYMYVYAIYSTTDGMICNGFSMELEDEKTEVSQIRYIYLEKEIFKVFKGY